MFEMWFEVHMLAEHEPNSSDYDQQFCGYKEGVILQEYCSHSCWTARIYAGGCYGEGYDTQRTVARQKAERDLVEHVLAIDKMAKIGKENLLLLGLK